MGSEYIGQPPNLDPNRQRNDPSPLYTQPTTPLARQGMRATSEQSDEQESDNDKTQPYQAVRPQQGQPARQVYQEPAYREHVSGALFPHPADAPWFRPAYNPYGANGPHQAQQPIVPQQPYQIQQPQQSQQPHQPQQSYQPPQYTGGQQGQNGVQQLPFPTAYPVQYPYPLSATHNGHAQSPASPSPQVYQGYPWPYHGYGYPYAPYPYYQPYYPQPGRPRRDGYLLAMGIATLAGSSLAFLGGCASVLFLLLVTALPTMRGLGPGQLFGSIVEFAALAFAGILGGAIGLYHSIRSVFLKLPSRQFKLPWFWTFLVLYIAVLVLASALRSEGQVVKNVPLATALILCAGILPAFTVMALGVRRVHVKGMPWPTTWRRFSIALVSGSTLAIALAGILELLLVAFVTVVLKVKGFSLTNLDQPGPQSLPDIGIALIVLSIIAPLVEEAVKPLAPVIMIGRINSAAEAFVLGLACGIGFDLIETAGYIGMGYRDWLDVAIQRSSAGLLHGFGAAMVTLGWYYITHPGAHPQRVRLAIGCWLYAVLQHAIWNGSSVLQLLPAPIGPYLNNGTIALGPYSFQTFLLVYVAETLIMLAFFLYVTGRLRGTPPAGPAVPGKRGTVPTRERERVAV